MSDSDGQPTPFPLWVARVVALAVFGGVLWAARALLVNDATALIAGHHGWKSCTRSASRPIGVICAATIIGALTRHCLGLFVARRMQPWVRKLEIAGAADDIAVTFVHGTFASRAPWTQIPAPLPSALVEGLSIRPTLYALEWTGENCHEARSRAAERLKAHIADVGRRAPHARHFIIAHSHGGNVALYALRNAAVVEKVAGVVTLATPFLHPISRFAIPSWDPWRFRVDDVTMLVRAPLLVISALLVGVPLYFSHRAATNSVEMFNRGVVSQWHVLLLFLLELFLLCGWTLIPFAPLVGIYDKWFRSAQTAEARLELAALDRTRLLIVRAPRDEASAALTILPLASAVMHLAGRGLVRMSLVPANALTVTRKWAEQRKSIVEAALGCAALLIGVVGFVYGMVAEGLSARGVLGASSFGVVTFFVVMLMMQMTPVLLSYVCAVFCMVLPTLVSIPLHVIAALAALPFGPDLVFSAAARELTAEVAPPGEWDVHVASGSTGGLMHSMPYADQYVCERITQWVRERISTPGLDRPVVSHDRAPATTR